MLQWLQRSCSTEAEVVAEAVVGVEDAVEATMLLPCSA